MLLILVFSSMVVIISPLRWSTSGGRDGVTSALFLVQWLSNSHILKSIE